MPKKITQNQILGEVGENAVRGRFLHMGFQFDVRSRLEAGIDGIAEVMDKGRPLARMIAVQVKATYAGRYTSEDADGFSYLLRSEDLDYWRPSNLPVIIVLYRQSDDSMYWKVVPRGSDAEERRLRFDKTSDVLDRGAVDQLADLTVPKAGFGYYVPPLGEGEEAVVNMLPLILPEEIFVATTSFTGRQATALLLEGGSPRFDWVIRGGVFWSFHDPRTSVCSAIVDPDQVEAIDTASIADHEDVDEQNQFSWLLRQTLSHQFRNDLVWNKDMKGLYFKAMKANTTRTFAYSGSKKKTEADVVNVSFSEDRNRVEFVRHHAFKPRFERLLGTWYLLIDPTYHFTTNGFIPHSKPAGLLAGKKRLDKSASLRGQVIMWHRLLSNNGEPAARIRNLFDQPTVVEPILRFGEPPIVQLSTRVPEDVWGTPKKSVASTEVREDLFA